MKDTRLFQFAVIALVTAMPSTGRAADNPPATATTAAVQQDDDGPCQFIRKFAADRLGTRIEGKDLQDLQKDLHHLHFPCVLPPSTPINFVIASVPNPIETHLQLWFDRSIESIQSAAGYSGFRFEGAWTPWDADLVREQPDIEKRKAQQDLRHRREPEPGVLLFRAPAECPSPPPALPEMACRDLVVLLVPETPTGGLAQDVFRDATKIALFTSLAFHHDPHSRIPVLGPAFSGSFSSLAKIMAQDTKTTPDAEIAGRLRVISGTAASSKAWEEAFKGKAASYNTTVHTVNDQSQMLVDYMAKVLHRDQKMALLTESETGLGWHFADPTTSGGSQIVYRYPREISRLRSAYGDQELKAVVGAQQQTPSFRRVLGFRLFDIGPSTDSTPVMAINQTPLSQDAVLEEIARAMHRDQITLAGIVATDIFDALFIARYLRDACPDIRLFTFDSDLLYEKGAEDFPFDGTLALSTYPLMPSNQIWTDLHRTGKKDATGEGTIIIQERTLFPSRGAEGTYNAMRILLVRSQYVSTQRSDDGGRHSHTSGLLEANTEGEQLAEYFDPTNCGPPSSAGAPQPGCGTPPIWLTVVTRDGYWPLAVAPFPEQHSEHKEEYPADASADFIRDNPQNGRMVSWPSPDNKSKFGFEAPPHIWRLIWVLIVLSLSWYFLSHLIACASGRGERQGFTHLNLWPHEEGWQARLCYLLICSLSLLAFYGIYILPLVAISDYTSHFQHSPHLDSARFGAELFFFVFLALACSPGLRFRRCRKSGVSAAGWPDTWHYGILALSALFIVFFAVEALLLFPLRLNPPDLRFTHQEAFFLAYRSLHLDSGVSPILPLLALLAAYFGWGRVHLKRVFMRFERLASLPVLGSGPEFKALADCQTRLEQFVNKPLPVRLRTLGSFGLAAVIFFYLPEALKSFEPATFDRLVLFLLVILYALLFLTWTRFLLIWKSFQPFLEQLDRHPIRFVFSDIPSATSISPLLQLTGRTRYLALVAVRDSLRMLAKNASDELTAEIGTFELHVGDVFAGAMDGIVVRQADAMPLLNSLNQINGIIVDALNQGCWREGHSERKVAEKDTDTAESVQEALREEIIAIQYRDYIQYIVHQQQNLLVFVITGFLLSMLALHSYPFQSPRIVTTFMSGTFLMFGAGIVMVLAQADRDPVLSRITKTTPDKLSGGFFLRTAGYLGVPLMTVLAAQFPNWGRFLFSWVQPLLEAMK